jgi:hypothetical protein
LLALLVLLLALAGIAVVLARPARIIGVSSKPLAASLAAEVNDPPEVSCGETGDGWRCRVGRSEDGRGVGYSLDVDDWGCWDARATGPGGRFFPTASACIWVIDYF